MPECRSACLSPDGSGKTERSVNFQTFMTERLYYNDSHLIEFDARIVNISTRDAKHLAVTLDRTAFYPTGGGQPNDTGWLNGAFVVNCINESERDAANVLHIVERVRDVNATNALEVGAIVTGRIDRERRLDHLQQHTAQHILSNAFIKLFDAETRGFRMFETVCEIDVAPAAQMFCFRQ